MKPLSNKTKTLVSSFVSLGVAASLIAGSTFALFTSESQTNIAITSGKVSVTATAELTKVYSAEWDKDANDYVDHETHVGEYVEETEYPFTNGGTAMYKGKTLTLSNISAGDGVEFKINVTNDSTISIKYQTVVTFADGGPTEEKKAADPDATFDEKALFKALNITVGDRENISSEFGTAVTAWSDPIGPGDDISPVTVKIELPMTADNSLQQETCKINIGVYAVQSNGNDTTNQDIPLNVHLVSEESDLGKVIEDMQDGDVLACDGDISLSADKPLEVPEGKDIVVDTQDNTLTVQSGSASAISVPASSSLTLKGKKTEGGEKSNVVLNSATKNKAAVEVNGKGAELNLEDVEIKCENANSSATGSIPKASIEVSDEANVSVKGSVINVVDENETSTDFKNPQALNATGDGTTVSMEETTVNVEGTAVALSAKENATMNIENSEININNGGGSCPALMVDDGGQINSINNKFNVTGDVQGTNGYGGNYSNAVAVIGDLPGGEFSGLVNIYGGVINLNPSSGRAYAVATADGNRSRVFVGGGLVINVNAEEGAFAAAFAIGQQSPVGYYTDPGELTVNVVATEDDRNKEIWKDSLWYNATGGFLPEPGKMPRP